MKVSVFHGVLVIILLGAFISFGQEPKKEEKSSPLPAPIGGPVDFFTVYDGTTLKKGEFTFSEAYRNYDEDVAAEFLLPTCRPMLPFFEDEEPAETFDSGTRLAWPLNKKFDIYKAKRTPPLCLPRR
jgi:hypothetical protein